MRTLLVFIVISLSSIISPTLALASEPLVVYAGKVTCAQANRLLEQEGQIKVKYRSLFGFMSSAIVTNDPQCGYSQIPEAFHISTKDSWDCQIGFHITCPVDPIYSGGGN